MSHLKEMVSAIRAFPGVTRKNAIHRVTDEFPTSGFTQVYAAEGEDAAVIDCGDSYVLFAADGIMQSLIESDPYLAGYFAVLVNVNDIAAMGGRPLSMVDVFSSMEPEVSSELIRGIKEGVSKFGVPVVGGHTHPDCDYNAIDISIIGKVRKDSVLLSSTAESGDDVVFAIDLEGHYPDSVPLAYETTLSRSPEYVRAQMEAVALMAEKHLIHSCKDISNPGHVGTLGMMLETSGKGATVDITKIPKPEGIDDIRWAKTYQGCGFVMSCDPSCTGEIISMFSDVGCSASAVGKIDDSGMLRITDGKEEEVLFDFGTDIITGIKPRQS